MYKLKYTTNKNIKLALKLIQEFPLGLLILKNHDTIEANYYPFYAEDQGGEIFLWMHLAKSNLQWQSLAGEVIVSFQGPNRYISPTIYVEPMNVPTWNYAVVQMRGTAEVLQDQQGLNHILNSSVAIFEKQNGTDWKYDLPPKMQQNLQATIVGIKIKVHHVEAKFKLSQNRDSSDYEAVSTYLESTQNSKDLELLRWMQLAK